MNRFEIVPAVLKEDEIFVVKHRTIKLYDGDQKVSGNQLTMQFVQNETDLHHIDMFVHCRPNTRMANCY